MSFNKFYLNLNNFLKRILNFLKINFSRFLLNPSSIIAIIYFMLTYYQLLLHDFDFKYFIHIGSRFKIVNNEIEDIGRGSIGYDGQIFYFIALNPFNAWKLFGEDASYRYQRILFPFLIRFFSLGKVELMPLIMLLINFISIIIATDILRRILKINLKNEFYSLFYGLFVGQLLAYSFDVVEPFLYMLIALAIYALMNNKLKVGMLLFALAMLAKETTIFFLGAYALSILLTHKYKYFIKFVAISIFPFLVLQISLKILFGKFGILESGPGFEIIPFYGIAMHEYNLSSFFKVFYVIVIPTCVACYLSIKEFYKRNFNPSVLYLFFNALFMVFLTRHTYHDIGAFGRTAIGLNLSYIIFGASKNHNRILKFIGIWVLPFTLWYIQRMPKL